MPSDSEYTYTGRQEMTTEERHSHWREIIDNQLTSGMSIAAYCRQSEIKSSYFYTIRRRLKALQALSGGFLELTPSKRAQSASAGIRIQLGDNLYVEVDRGFDPFTLRAIVETLSGLS